MNPRKREVNRARRRLARDKKSSGWKQQVMVFRTKELRERAPGSWKFPIGTWETESGMSRPVVTVPRAYQVLPVKRLVCAPLIHHA